MNCQRRLSTEHQRPGGDE